MKHLLAILPLFLHLFANAQNDSVQYYFTKAKEAGKAAEHARYYTMIKKAYRLHPYHPAILYHTAIASSLNGKPDEALAMLKKALHVNARADLGHEAFAPLRTVKGFQSLKDLQASLMQPVVQSDTAFVIPDRTLHIECIATGEKEGIFYLGSIHKRKIVRVNPDKTVSDFTTPAQDGLASVFGIKVDRKRKILWACASPMEETENRDSSDRSGVFKYDITTGKLLHKFHPEGVQQKEFVFGDITLHPDGDVFISDSKNNLIFTIADGGGKMELFFTSPEFWNIQGITFSADGKSLFISDYVKGIYRLDMKTKKLERIKEQFDESTKSVDGLTFYKNSLIAIQNNIFPMRVAIFSLNIANDSFIDYRVIDKAHPAFNEPTIGCLSGDTFYYVANSLWSGYTETHDLKTPDQLTEAVILKVDLRLVK
jgi:sugar lactone lactonase YvrE